jgi:ADP-heptose:LPS heptosyltransferase
MKVLVISLAGIGDTLFATPLIHELRANYPGAQINALVLWRGAKDVLEGNPHLNTVYQKNLIQAGSVASLKYLLTLRRERYDLSLSTHPQSRVQYRVVARVIGARLRASHRYECSGPLDALLVNRTIPQDYHRHAIDNNLALLPLVGAAQRLPRPEYELFLSTADLEWAAQFVAANGLAGRVCLGLHVGSGGTKNLPLRRWPVENYVALIRRLTPAHPNLTVLLFGGPEEEQAHAAILSQMDRRQVLEVKSGNLRQAAALLKTCSAFLSVDTALMHLAAAMKVPGQIVIETPTWNKPIEPYGQKLEYYRYDGKGIRGTAEELTRCMASVGVQEVLDAIESQLASRPGGVAQ